jgi:tetratricopeptide (TPR) repeat protein
MRWLRWSINLAVLFLILSACSDESRVAPQEPPLDRSYENQQGWSLFRSTDIQGAAIHFNRLVEHFPDAADGYLGLGWCEIELDRLEQAIAYLETAIRLSDEPDAFAGLAVAASALGRDSVAVDAASRFNNVEYLFLGDPEFGFTDLVYIRALGQFHLLRYEDCYASIQILRPSFEIDMSAYDFRTQLFRQLQYLRRQV